MNHECVYRLSVKAVVFDQLGRILLVRENDGVWDMLGGGLEYEEDPLTCLHREVMEESGLVINDVSRAPLFISTYKKPNKDVYIANVVYEVSLKNLDFTPSNECQEIQYFDMNELGSIDLHTNVKAALNQLVQHAI